MEKTNENIVNKTAEETSAQTEVEAVVENSNETAAATTYVYDNDEFGPGFWVIAGVIIVLFIAGLAALLFAGKNADVKYLTITEDGIVSIAPEYIDTDYYFNEKRLTEDEKQTIEKQAAEMNITAKEYMLVSAMLGKGYDYVYDDTKQLKEAMDECEKVYGSKPAELYSTMLNETPLADFIISCKLSEYKEMEKKDTLTVPKKIRGVKPTSVAPYGFACCTAVDEIVFPDTVKSVGVYAFEASTAKKIIFESDKVNIDPTANTNCASLEKIECGENHRDILPSLVAAKNN